MKHDARTQSLYNLVRHTVTESLGTSVPQCVCLFSPFNPCSPVLLCIFCVLSVLFLALKWTKRGNLQLKTKDMSR